MIGCAIHRFGIVSSTNDIARDLASTGAPEGTVVVADEQVKGRGSRGRSWVSPAGANLLLSVVLRPEIPIERLGELAFVAAVGVANTLRGHCGLDARLKWPNDVLVDGRKIAGMIVETGKGAAILGIGLNVNWTELPSEIMESATSVAILTGRETDLDALLAALLVELDIDYGVYRARGFPMVLSMWRELQVTVGQDVMAQLESRSVCGTAVDVDDGGNLLIETDTGERLTVSAATVLQ